MDYSNEMIAVLRDSGLLVDSLVFDGQLHRTPTTAKPNRKDGWYVAFVDGQSILFGNWITGVEKTYSVKEESNSRHDLAALKKARISYKQTKLAKQKQSAAECQEIWANAKGAIKMHPYTIKKNIIPYGARFDKNNNMLVPILDQRGDLVNIQFINKDGKKYFKGGSKLKGCALMLGSLTEQTTILVCEGYATGCSLHEATNMPVVVAFNAGNLLDVCTSIKQNSPYFKIVLCADNDHVAEKNGRPNVGLDKAKAVATALNIKVIWPQFSDVDLGSDFNDIYCQYGLNALRTMLASLCAEGFE